MLAGGWFGLVWKGFYGGLNGVFFVQRECTARRAFFRVVVQIENLTPSFSFLFLREQYGQQG